MSEINKIDGVHYGDLIRELFKSMHALGLNADKDEIPSILLEVFARIRLGDHCKTCMEKEGYSPRPFYDSYLCRWPKTWRKNGKNSIQAEYECHVCSDKWTCEFSEAILNEYISSGIRYLKSDNIK